MTSEDFPKFYSAKDDDEILRLACDPDDLKSGMRFALNEELQRRRLSQADIEQYRQHLSLTKPGEMPGKQKFVARSYNGFGTAVYGKRDFWPDGSFISTKWLIFFWIPVFPIRTWRLLDVGHRSTGFLPGWSTQYRICETTPLNVKQVSFVYCFAIALVLAIGTISYLPTPIAYTALFCVSLLPWSSRKFARKKSWKAPRSGPAL